MTYRFQDIGPIGQAELELGDLTIVAGRNNTGKTYLAYTLYGFLRMWESIAFDMRSLLSSGESWADPPGLNEAVQKLKNNCHAIIGISDAFIQDQRAITARKLAAKFSKDGISQVFHSANSDFSKASITIRNVDDLPPLTESIETKYRLDHSCDLSMTIDSENAVVSVDRGSSPISKVVLNRFVRLSFISSLMRNVFPEPFILSSERFGISLFYRELDFTKNQLVDVMKQLGTGKRLDGFSLYRLFDKATSRYTLPIKDNIDYARDIPHIINENSPLLDRRLFGKVTDIVEGYYTISGDEIRFISKPGGTGHSFNIPMHLASSSVRGMSDLYFFLRHTAKPGQLLIIDEPESHLDTRNQIFLARLLARFVATGLKVLVTTHSDYLLKEINNLVMLSGDLRDKETVMKKLQYVADDAIDPDIIRAYVAENEGITRCTVDEFGIEMPVFDKTIDEINRNSTQLAWARRQ